MRKHVQGLLSFPFFFPSLGYPFFFPLLREFFPSVAADGDALLPRWASVFSQFFPSLLFSEVFLVLNQIDSAPLRMFFLHGSGSDTVLLVACRASLKKNAMSKLFFFELPSRLACGCFQHSFSKGTLVHSPAKLLNFVYKLFTSKKLTAGVGAGSLPILFYHVPYPSLS